MENAYGSAQCNTVGVFAVEGRKQNHFTEKCGYA